MTPILSAPRFYLAGKRWFSEIAIAYAARHNEPKIEPAFWRQREVVNPEQYLIDCNNYDMTHGPDTIPELRTRILKNFDDVGLVLLRNTRLQNDLGKMGDWARFPMGVGVKYEGGGNPRSEIVPNVYDAGAPNAAYLHYHHEMEYIRQSVRFLGFCAMRVIQVTEEEPHRGHTFVSENLGVTETVLKTSFGQKLKDKGICYIRCLTDREAGTPPSVYNHWQVSFGTEDPKEAERLANQKGLIVEWGPGRYMRTKYYVSGFEYFPKKDKNVLFSAIGDHGSLFDTWPGVAELPDLESFETATPEQKPLKITFGDDTPMTRDDLVTFAQVYDEHGFPIAWQEGDIAVVCNYSYAHGRPAYHLQEGEQRVLGVCLGGMFDRVGSLEGKW